LTKAERIRAELLAAGVVITNLPGCFRLQGAGENVLVTDLEYITKSEIRTLTGITTRAAYAT
jgi:hypothetical protein